jgi:hypothetical protein
VRRWLSYGLSQYNALGGPNGNGHVSFNRANSQYLSSVSSALGLTTNGGFGMIVVVYYESRKRELKNGHRISFNWSTCRL